MASLTHVCVWSKNGWKRITPEEVAREHSRGGVSARSGIFMCSLCGQYVTFFNGRVQAPHFRHSSAEADKSCPERMYVHGYDYTYAAGEHELPIRIVNVTDYGFEFELGLLAVPRIVLNQQEKKNVTVIPSDKAMTPFVYSFERLNAESITYVSIGEYPSEAFRQDRKRKSHKLFSIQKFAAFTSSRINRFILSSKVSLLSLLK